MEWWKEGRKERGQEVRVGVKGWKGGLREKEVRVVVKEWKVRVGVRMRG